MSKLVSDNAAICFTAAFYQALGFGQTIKTAFALGCNQLKIEYLLKYANPVRLPETAAYTSVTDPRRMDLLASIVLLKLGQGSSNERAENARQWRYLKNPATNFDSRKSVGIGSRSDSPTLTGNYPRQDWRVSRN